MILKDDTQQSIGKPKDRVDGQLKVTGGARYSAEMPVPGLAHAALVTSTIANGTITAMDVTQAAASDGVLAVLTPFNAPRLASTNKDKARPQDRVLSLLQDQNVYYDRQPIGVVVAETLEQAIYAASLVGVTYDAQKPATIMEEERDNIYKPDKVTRATTDSLRGDPASVYAQAPVKNQQIYSTPVENHNPMEPHATIAVWAGNHLTVYDATQGVFGVKSNMARIFGIPQENVRCVAYFVGGGFGCKGTPWSHVALCAMAAQQTNRPVKLVLERSQMYGPVGYRPITEQTIALSARTGGDLLSTSHHVYTQTSTFDEFVEPSAVVTRMLYECPNMVTTHRLTRLNYGTPTFMRAPGESTGTYALEAAMDEMAYRLNMDPVAFRLANYANLEPEKKIPFSSKSLKECYEQGAAAFGWDKRASEPGSMRTPDGQLIGYGMATATYPTNRSPASAQAKIQPNGTADVQAGSQDIGTGTYTVMTQVSADALGLRPENVRFGLGDTDMPHTPVSGGSQTAASVGSAVWETGLAARQQAIALAVADSGSPLFGADPTLIDVADGRMSLKSDPTKGETYAQLIARQNLPFIQAQTESKPDQDAEKYAMHAFGACFVEVHVDPDLGEVRIKRIIGAYGVGNRLNAKTATSQLMGGIVFGIGMALLEQTMIDARTGRVMNADLAEYHVPVNKDVPPIEVIFVDETDLHVNPLGIKGIGEIGITGTVAAITNAVYHATGTRVRALPLTLDKLIS